MRVSNEKKKPIWQSIALSVISLRRLLPAVAAVEGRKAAAAEGRVKEKILQVE